MWNLEGKTALVTGGARRLGAETVRALAGRGVNCVIHYRTAKAEAERLGDEIRNLGVSAFPVWGDLSTGEGATEVWKRSLAVADRIDILVNSASSYEEETLDGFSIEGLAAAAALNAYAPLILTRALSSQGIEGAVVMLLDARMNDYDRNHIGYHESKRLLFSLMRMLAVDLAPRVRVNGVAPGAVLPEKGKEDAGTDHLARTNPLGRVGTAEEVTDAILFLLANRFITGQVVFVDGGRHIRGNFYG
jgi:NAD(P)-dependent dehydrogenase (short-subunit alcohol dehydrogenase family)